MLTTKFTRVVAILLVICEVVSIGLTFAGAFIGGKLGRGLLATGMFGFVAAAVFGWILITVYNRVHKDEFAVNAMMEKHAEELADEAKKE